MTETLMVTCSQCGRAFPTPLQVDRATLEALVLTKAYECPRCHPGSLAGRQHPVLVRDTQKGYPRTKEGAP